MSKSAKDLVNKEIIKRVALLASTGANVYNISKETGISRHLVRKVMEMPEYQEELRNTTEEVTAEAKHFVRRQFANLAREAVRVLTEQMRERNSLEAVKMVLKGLGIENDESNKNGDTNITVQLPGAVQTAIEVESEVSKNEIQDTEN